LYLLGVCGGGQSGIRLGQRLLQLVEFAAEGDQLPARVFVFAEGRDGLGDLVRIHLRDEINVNDHRVVFDASGALLIEDEEETRCVCPDFVGREIHVAHDRHALQVGCDLLQGVPLRGLERQILGVQLCVVVAHPVFPLSGDCAEIGEGRVREG